MFKATRGTDADSVVVTPMTAGEDSYEKLLPPLMEEVIGSEIRSKDYQAEALRIQKPAEEIRRLMALIDRLVVYPDEYDTKFYEKVMLAHYLIQKNLTEPEKNSQLHSLHTMLTIVKSNNMDKQALKEEGIRLKELLIEPSLSAEIIAAVQKMTTSIPRKMGAIEVLRNWADAIRDTRLLLEETCSEKTSMAYSETTKKLLSISDKSLNKIGTYRSDVFKVFQAFKKVAIAERSPGDESVDPAETASTTVSPLSAEGTSTAEVDATPVSSPLAGGADSVDASTSEPEAASASEGVKPVDVSPAVVPAISATATMSEGDTPDVTTPSPKVATPPVDAKEELRQLMIKIIPAQYRKTMDDTPTKKEKLKSHIETVKAQISDISDQIALQDIREEHYKTLVVFYRVVINDSKSIKGGVKTLTQWLNDISQIDPDVPGLLAQADRILSKNPTNSPLVPTLIKKLQEKEALYPGNARIRNIIPLLNAHVEKAQKLVVKNVELQRALESVTRVLFGHDEKISSVIRDLTKAIKDNCKTSEEYPIGIEFCQKTCDLLKNKEKEKKGYKEIALSAMENKSVEIWAMGNAMLKVWEVVSVPPTVVASTVPAAPVVTASQTAVPVDVKTTSVPAPQSTLAPVSASAIPTAPQGTSAPTSASVATPSPAVVKSSAAPTAPQSGSAPTSASVVTPSPAVVQSSAAPTPQATSAPTSASVATPTPAAVKSSTAPTEPQGTSAPTLASVSISLPTAVKSSTVPTAPQSGSAPTSASVATPTPAAVRSSTVPTAPQNGSVATSASVGTTPSATVQSSTAPTAPQSGSVATSASVGTTPSATVQSSAALTPQATSAPTSASVATSTPAAVKSSTASAVPQGVSTPTSAPASQTPAAKVDIELEAAILALKGLLDRKYHDNDRVKSITEEMIASVRAENKKKADAQWTRRISLTYQLLDVDGVPSPELVKQYHNEAMALHKEKHATGKKVIGACMIALAVALVAAAVVAVPFLSLAIVGMAALSSTVATALAATPFGVGAAASALGGGFFFRKTAVTRKMLALENEVTRPSQQPAQP